ncbi:MAG: hypothetical protein NTU63_02595 [Candidatus Pacearchaeota archaeon]|nr:hypothetical protein [Candidatus Pacearchaeota archaeon]
MQDNPHFVKYRRIPHLDEVPCILDNLVEVYEKVDGGNVQIRKINGRILSGSRAHFLTREKFFSQEWFKDFNKWALGNYSFYNLLEDLVIYGEWTSKHTLEYKPEFTNKFFMIDLFDLGSKRFIPYEKAREILKDMEIENLIYLEVLFKGKTDFNELTKMIEGSKYRYGNKEGLVIKNYNLQEFAKLWTSSVKRKGVVNVSDVKNVILGLKDSQKRVNKETVIQELELELKRSNRRVSSFAIESEVDYYFENSDN